jgi:hypothetical protein
MESTLDLLLVGYKRIWHLYAGPFLEYESHALVSFKKYMPPPLPYFKVNIFPLPIPHFASIFFAVFVILSLTQLYRYTPEIFLFSTATFKYKYRAPLRRIGQEYSAKVAFSIFQSLKRFALDFSYAFGIL